MKKLDKTSILKQFEESGKLMYNGTLTGDYKTCNRENDKLIKIYKFFEKDKDFAWECISEMLKSSNVVVRAKAASYCLALNMHTDIAQETLIEIRDDGSNGIFSFNAKMTLKVWEEKGCLRVYLPK